MVLRSSYTSDSLLESLKKSPTPNGYTILVSGGVDSMVLLSSMASIRQQLHVPLRVLHFDHEIQKESSDWARLVYQAATELQIDCEVQRLGLGSRAGETIARQARYRHLASRPYENEFYLSAHHADDQAETFLLQALRGSGVDGLAAMPVIRRLGRGWLVRPLLSWSREDLLAWARSENIVWAEDPENSNLVVPRNRLRHEIAPKLATIASQPGKRLAATASRLGETRQLLEDLAQDDLESLNAESKPRALPVSGLRGLSVPRRHNLLRHWLRLLELPMPLARKIQEVGARLIASESSDSGCVAWPGCEIRLYHGKLYPMAPLPPLPSTLVLNWEGIGRLLEIEGCGRLVVSCSPACSGSLAYSATGLSIRFRQGGERLTPLGTAHHRPLKKLMQEQAVLPWMRSRVPLVYVDDQLISATEVAVTQYAKEIGLSVSWEPFAGMPVKAD